MKTITVSASKEYSVHVGKNLLPSLGAMLAAVITGRKAFIVSDSNVWPIYGEKTAKSLISSGFSVYNFVFQAGESSKSPETYLQILNCLCQNKITRSDCIVALGGGVVGDLAGFSASTYLRGINYIQLPTTLLSMVDSSVGGKTAIDLPAGKNLVGTFYQPTMVVCDTDTLDTLPDEEFTSGCAEVIKYSILYDRELFVHLEQKGKKFCREDMISRCIEWKKRAVEQDEFDNGVRQMLNLGHTIGHSIEKVSNYSVNHGVAVAIGISIMSRFSESLGICSQTDCKRMIDLLQQFQLPISTDFSAEILAQNALSDKKRSSDCLNLILPATIGCCIFHPIPIRDLESIIKAGM